MLQALHSSTCLSASLYGSSTATSFSSVWILCSSGGVIFRTGSTGGLGIEAPDKAGGVRGRNRRSRCGSGRKKYLADCRRDDDDDDDDDDDGIDGRRGVKSGKSREKKGSMVSEELELKGVH